MLEQAPYHWGAHPVMMQRRGAESKSGPIFNSEASEEMAVAKNLKSGCSTKRPLETNATPGVQSGTASKEEDKNFCVSITENQRF